MNLKKYTKNTSMLILALLLICSALMVPSLGFISNKTSAGTNYVVIEGVAGNDSYDSMQYSYKINEWASNQNISGYNSTLPSPGQVYFNAQKSLRFGITEYGEICTPQGGIAYGANSAEWANSESWSSTSINPKYYIQGWVFYMNYTRQGTMRVLEAYALYSDLTTTEGARKVYSWFGQYYPNDPLAVLTGNGTLIPSGVTVLYDSARLAIVRASVTIHDGKYDEDVAQVFLTAVFQKDTKYVTFYKDVKILLDPKVLDFISDFSFGERYEIDIARGVNPSNGAFTQWFPNNITSVYQHPLTGTNTVDISQAYDPARQYQFFAAYWPNTTEHTNYSPLIPDLPSNDTRVLPVGWLQNDILKPPFGPGEASTPWNIAQWRYNNTAYPKLLTWLAKAANRQIRFVEVAGMSDVNVDPHPIMDTDAATFNSTNQVDVEALYLLNQVFNPEDLSSLNGTAGTGQNPFMWTGLGQSAATTDSGGAGLVGSNGFGYFANAFTLFDRNDTMFPYIAPVVGMRGSIPYGLSDFGGNYYEQFSNSGTGNGADTTTYKRTALKGFAFGAYDDVASSPPQPIAGGWSSIITDSSRYWYPSKDPLTERWLYSGTSWSMVGYTGGVNYHPNGILSLGGMKANGLTRYFNDFNFAISREGTSAFALVNGGSVTGSAPTSDSALTTYDYYPVSSWAVNKTAFGFKAGYAVISLARDINGTRGLSVYGWDGRDTFWATAWASQYITGNTTSWLPKGTVALILNMTYPGGSSEPTAFTVVKALGTITEFGSNNFLVRQGSFDLSVAWTGGVAPPSTPTGWTIIGMGSHEVWWYLKLSATSAATIEFDP